MIGAHAVVLGASMAGLLAARVLAEHYRAVTVVERDELPEAAANRRGVPQGHHAHGLLGRGSLILADLFPGFEDELLTAGVPAFDYRDLSRASFFLAGHHAPNAGAFSTVPPLYFPSRPLLESLVRRRVRAIENVDFLTAHDVVDLTSTPGRDRITGARVAAHDGARRTRARRRPGGRRNGPGGAHSCRPRRAGIRQACRGQGDRARGVFQSVAADPAGHAAGDGGGDDAATWKANRDGTFRL